MSIPFLFVMLLPCAGGMGVSASLFLCIRSLRRRMHLQVEVVQVPSPLSKTGSSTWRRVSKLQTLGRRLALIGAAVVTNVLSASVATAQTSLHHIDPVIFVALQMVLLLPVTLVLLWFSRRSCPALIVRQGFIGGLFLGIAFVGVALSLRSLGMIPTALLMALDGVIASGISWLILRQRQSVSTCLAAGCAASGAFLLWWVSPSAWQADVLALGGGCLFTLYAFHVERSELVRGSIKRMGGFLGGLFGSMAAMTLALALCFGWWPSLQSFSAADLNTLVYTSLATVLIPVALSTFLLRHISAVSLAFFALLEPLASIVFAAVFGSLSFPFFGWFGVGFIFLSVLVQAGAAAVSTKPAARKEEEEALDIPASAGVVVHT